MFGFVSYWIVHKCLVGTAAVINKISYQVLSCSICCLFLFQAEYDSPYMFYEHTKAHVEIYPLKPEDNSGFPCLWQGMANHSKTGHSFVRGYLLQCSTPHNAVLDIAVTGCLPVVIMAVYWHWSEMQKYNLMWESSGNMLISAIFNKYWYCHTIWHYSQWFCDETCCSSAYPDWRFLRFCVQGFKLAVAFRLVNRAAG